MFSKKGVGNRRLNLLNEDHLSIARDLLNAGYQKADFPVSHPSKKYWDETDLRAIDMKWDTVIRRYVRMRGSSLLNPSITLHAIARNGFGNAKLRYFAAVSIEAPRYTGSLYDAILQSYKNLTPIEIRNVNRIMVDRQHYRAKATFYNRRRVATRPLRRRSVDAHPDREKRHSAP